MVAALKHNDFTENLAEKVHNLSADTLKVMLVNSPAPLATHLVKASLTEIAAGNGYTAGGATITVTSSAQSPAGTYKLVLVDVVFTAAGGTIGPFQYCVVYNDTPTSPADPLIQTYNYGSPVTLADGETFTVDFDPSTGVLTLA